MEHSKKRIIVTTIIGTILFVLGVSLFVVGLSIKRPIITFYDDDYTTVLGTESVAIGKQGGTKIIPHKEAEPGYQYNFVGWEVEDEETGTKEVVKLIDMKKDKPITAYAVYRVIKLPYEIVYNLNGGAIKGEYKTSYTVTDKYQLPEPTKAGYTFIGWYDSDKYTTLVREIKAGTTGKISLYAKWEAIKYQIKYNLDGGVQAPNAITEFTIATNAKLPTPTKENAVFAGWYDKEGNLVESITPGRMGRLELTAHWTNKLAYHLNGGFNQGKVIEEYELGDAIDLPIPTRYGYEFVGWCLDENLTDTPFTKMTATKPAVTDLYAKWERVADGVVFKEDNKQYVYFGSYPQSVVNDYKTISKLEKLCEKTNKCVYEGVEYVKITANPLSINYRFNGLVESLVETTVEKKIVSSINIAKKTYYFRVEPIKWQVVSSDEKTMQLLSLYALDATSFGATNNYSTSVVRKWLNDTFYNTAFSKVEKQSIKLTVVDNSAATTGTRTDNQYTCDPTNDYVYLMSYKEVTKVKYGFKSSFDDCDPAKYCEVTEYARAKGAKMNLNDEYFGYTDWMLRSPFVTEKNSISFVRGVGKAETVGTVERWAQSNAVYAVRPMITIELQKVI